MTLDNAVIDLGNNEMKGVSFVGLSRVRKISNLQVAPSDFERYKHNDNVFRGKVTNQFGLFPADTALWSTYDRNVCRFQGQRYKALIGKKVVQFLIFIDAQE
jgi:hypothetical protein